MSKLLKKDIFGEIVLCGVEDEPHIVRDTRTAARWIRPIARHLLRREVRALQALGGLAGVPQLIDSDDRTAARTYIKGRPMQQARPTSPAYFRAARGLLRQLHRRGVVHNDLAKEPNWLVGTDGMPALIDFQLASIFKNRSATFRVLAYEDLRHLLKHKRSYCNIALTARERRILDRPALVSRLWMASGKKLYLLVTRKMLGWQDREGAGDR